MKGKIFGGIALTVVVIGMVVLLWRRPVVGVPQIQPANRLQVVASFYPLAFLAEQIGGEHVNVINITPPGAEPHDYELTPSNLVSLQSANVILLNGAHLEPWAEKVAADTQIKGHIATMSNQLPDITDPHIWLDPAIYQAEAVLVRDALMAADPAHTEDYLTNSYALIAKIDALDREYMAGLATCTRRDIVVSHAAFQYLGKRYKLQVLSIAGLSPDEEPSPRRLAEIATIAKTKHIEYIFFENFVSPKLAETVANEIGAKSLVLNPLEGLTDEQKQQGENYFSVMNENLHNLEKAMVCASNL